jgi:eukaryotic-like serine/threonine-protein kinase
MSESSKGRTMIGVAPPISILRSQPPVADDQVPAAAPPAQAAAPPPQAAPPPPAPDDLVGHELCGYTIKRRLAEGGMGVVYEGEHGKIGRRGAIKVLRLEYCRSEDVIERFHQEARAVNAIRHENIVDIYDFGRDPHGRVFFVMELLEGEPLSAWIRRGPLTWPEAFAILEQTLRALKAAHDKGFVHRDLKPDNIFLRNVDGRVGVKLLDFGIAKLVGSESPKEKLTRTGSAIGTPHYMSPEQINGAKDVDHRTDLYALGVITYEMFAGVTPFVGETLQAVITGHLFQEPPRLADLPPSLGVPAPLADIVDRMLVKDPAGRYGSAADVLADLHDINASRWPAKAETMNRTWPTRPPAGATAPMGGTVPMGGTAPMGAPAAQPAVPAAQPRGTGQRATAIVGALAVAALVVAGVAIWRLQQRAPQAPAAEEEAPAAVAAPAPAQPAEPPLDYEAIRKDAQTTLRASLREAEPAVRIQGSDALGKIKDQPSVPVLTELTEKDPDLDVRGHTGEALGALGAVAAAPLLGRLEAGAPPPLKVWYASALARLGDKAARQRLLEHARSTDLAIALKAAFALGEVSPPGDRDAIDALRKLATHEAELNQLAPFAGVLILTKLAALRDGKARELLQTYLADKREDVRLAAAEGLAKLGDDAGKRVLQEVLASSASPNRLVAAVAQIPLGEYGGFDLITQKLGDKDPGVRRLAARALGEIGERKSLRALIALAGDQDWTLRIAAAAAIVAIVGLDPQVLAQASVDWTKSALDSQDWAARRAAAGVLADIPEGDAMPLLAQALTDQEPGVRLAAARSAGKMKSPGAAAKVAAGAKVEKDPAVKEQQVVALGAIGSPTVVDTLVEIAREPGRIGVIAAGSLIAVGDASGKDKLEAAVAAPAAELRLAAVQAASTARSPIVVPTLKIGIGDRVFEVRLAAAEGLAEHNAEKAAAVPVLTAALASKDAGVLGRAMAALLRFGERAAGGGKSAAELLDSADPRLRLAAVPIVRALPPAASVPLLRRLVADPDRDVRRAGVDAIESVARKDKEQAIRLYKPLVTDADPMVRAKASGQLARLVPPPPPRQPQQPQTAADAAPAAATATATAATPPVDPRLAAAAGEATAAAAEARAQADAFEALVADFTAATSATAHDDATLARVEDLTARLGQAVARLDAAAAKVGVAAQAAAAAAGASPAPDAAKLVQEARALEQRAREAAAAARAKLEDARQLAQRYKKTWTGDPQILIAAADASIATGDFADARQNLGKAARLIQQSGARRAGLDYSYAQLFDKMAARAQDRAAKRKLLQQAEEAYRRFAKSGTGPRVQRATDRAAELADELKELGQP